MPRHYTKRLAEKLSHDHVRTAATAVLQEERTPLGQWHEHLLLLDRRQCVLFCHDLTRYVFFLPGLRADHVADLGHWHQELFLATLIRSSFLTHLGFVMVSTRRMKEWNDENNPTEVGK